MKIQRLSLENFQGIRQAEFDFAGRNANIYGSNATGKTTLFSAFTWILFGKPSTGADNYSPKTRTEDGEAHNLDHAAECELDINGQTVTLRRVFHEVYKKTRGNPDAVMSGHTTDYYINGVPKKESEYARYLSEILSNDELPKLLTMPFYFAETLHWEKRRGILLDICGDLSAIDVVNADDELKKLPALLGNLSVDEYKKMIKASLTEINRKIQGIPARIDEANRAIGEFTSTNPAELPELIEDSETWIAGAREKRKELEEERFAIISGATGSSKIRAELAETEAKLSELKAAHADKCQKANADAQQTVYQERNALAEAKHKADDIGYRLNNERKQLKNLEAIRGEIIAEYAAIRQETFDDGALICPTCGQSFPADKAESMRESFNVNKSNKLERTLERGKREASKEMIQASDDLIAALEKELAGARSAGAAIQDKLSRLSGAAPELPKVYETPEYIAVTDEIDRLKKALADTDAQSANLTKGVDEKLSALAEADRAANDRLAGLKTAQTQYARIAELETEQKSLGKAYEEAQQGLYLCERFSRVKAALLTDRINEKFSTVSFRLFKKNITNDGIDDVCEVLIPTPDGQRVPFALSNNAARINAGLEIIGVLSEHYGVELPIWVDNAESVVRVIPIKAQLIRLIVSEADKQLRFEPA
ncbi:AAA family ATPase [Synergistales bacterium]|nr:AAA family ATPase [Synergistales bacterium]